MTRVLSADWVLPIEGPPIADGAVALGDGRIAAVGTRAELGEGERFEGAALLPGLVNAHTHLEYAVYAGFGDGLAFGPWLALHIERTARIGWDEFVAIARLGAAECLRSGVTTIADASFSGAAAVAMRDLGLRGHVGLEAETDGAVELGISPHAPYSVGPEVYRGAIEAGRRAITHVAESDDELAYLLRGEGPIAHVSEIEPPGTTPVRHLAAEGLLGPSLVAAHCVKVDAEEIALLAEHDVPVAHCPRSNALLGCGIAPLRELRAAGLRVGLGTDSPASTPSFDLFDELRAAVFAARAREGSPDALSASEALELATLGSAGALGLDAEIGSLAPGKRADLTVVSLAGSPYLPWEDPAAAVVFGGSPERVELTLVAGEERYRKGTTAWRDLRRRAESGRLRLLGALPPAPKT